MSLGNQLLLGMTSVEAGVAEYKEQVRRFYFEVLFTKYRCPRCGGTLKIIRPSAAACRCGLRLDPTIAFQRSPCCGVELVKKICHYACSKCDQVVHSRFLFDERVFDAEYFRDRMASYRSKRKRETGAFRHLITGGSGPLWLTDDIDIGELKGLTDDLDNLCGDSSGDSITQIDQPDSEFHISAYWRHICTFLTAGETTFESIDSLSSDARKDRAWRFITLIFMEHDQEVYLSQFGNDILVERV